MTSKEQLESIIYKKYSFLNISKAEYKKIFNEIEKKFDNENMENALIKRLDNKCKHLFEKNPLLITNNFIENNFIDGNSYNTYLSNINFLVDFLGGMSYLPDLVFFESLYQNEKFKQSIDAVVDANIEIIKKGKIDEYFDNEIIIFMIDEYCSINNIEIDEFNLSLENNIKYNGIKQYLMEISKQSALTDAEQQDLLLKISNGDEIARNKFIEANLGLVIFVAKKYINRGLQFLDLIQEGNLGLIEAVDHYNINSGYKFSTYAICCIKGHILKFITKYGSIVRVPIYKQYLIPKYKKLVDLFENSLNRKPTYEELAFELKVSVSVIKDLDKSMSISVTSIDEKVNDDSDHEVGEFIPDENNNLEKNVENICLKNDLLKLINQCKISDRDKEIFIQYFGIDTDSLNMTELSQKYNLTRQRIEIIVNDTLKKIRKIKDTKKLVFYLDNPDKNNLDIDVSRCAANEIDDAEKNEIISTLYDLQDNILYVDGLCINNSISVLHKIFPKVSPIILQMFMNCKLNNDEIKILILKYGLDDHKIYEIEEICEKTHLTKKFVQKLEINAFLKIKSSIYFKHKMMIKKK